ncbi:MAG: hypothetical protein ACRDS9_23850, partial [Pseudonocardiaceae bacterium]
MKSGHPRAHNYQLRKLLDEANGTGDTLAREVNTVGAKAGLSLHRRGGRIPRRIAAHQHAAV